MATEKIHIIEVHRRGYIRESSGTLSELTKSFSYVLEVGESWQHEKGNKKINRNPKSIKTLVDNINKAKTNAAANGCSDTYYTLKN